MVKVNSNIPELVEIFSDQKKNDITTSEVKINNKTYTITKIQQVKWGTFELIGRRLLGGFLTVISLGLFLKYKNSQDLFDKIKELNVTAILTPDSNVFQPIDKAADNVNSDALQGHPTPEFRETSDLEFQETSDLKPESSEEKLPEKPPAKEIIPFNFDKLPREIQGQIMDQMEVPLLLKLMQGSKRTKAIAEEVLQKKELELFVEMLEAKGKVDKAFYEKILTEITNKPHTFVRLLLLLDSKIHSSIGKGSKEAFTLFLTLFIEKKFFTAEVLSTIDSHIVERLLNAVFRQEKAIAQSKEIQDLYLKFASPRTFLTYFIALLQKGPLDIKNTQALLNRMQKCFDLGIPTQRDKFQELFLEFVVIQYSPQSTSFSRRKADAFALIEEKLPDLTMGEFTRYMGGIWERHLNLRRNPAIRIPPTFVAWKLIQLCQSTIPDTELRIKFNQIFQEGLSACPPPIRGGTFSFGWEGKSEWIREFMGSTDEYWQNAPQGEQPEIVRRLVYTFNGLRNIAYLQEDNIRNSIITLPADNLRGMIIWNQKEYPELMKIALREWMHSYRDGVFFEEFAKPLQVIKSQELLEPMIEEALKFDEPLKTLYLFVLGNYKNQDKEKAFVADAFKKFGLEIPSWSPAIAIDFILNTAACYSFVQTVKKMQNPEDLDAFIKATMTLPLYQKEARLRALAHFIHALNFGIGVRGQEAFTANRLNIDEFQSNIDSKQLMESVQPFTSILSQIELNEAVKSANALKSPDREEALCVLAHLEMRPVLNCPLSLEERKKVFASNGLNLDEIPAITISEFLDAEKQAFEANNSEGTEKVVK